MDGPYPQDWFRRRSAERRVVEGGLAQETFETRIPSVHVAKYVEPVFERL